MTRALKNKYKILNLILIAVVLSAAGMNYETWSRSNDSAEDLAGKLEAMLESPSETTALTVKEEPKSVQSYSVIAEKNIFSPDRKNFLSPSLALAEAPKTSIRPQVVLSGVAISDAYQSASISTPGRLLKKGERETMTLKPGDRIGEYRLAKIEADRITMEAAGDSFDVLLHDPKKPKVRVEVKTGIQPIVNEARTAQPAPGAPQAVDIAKVEVAEKPAEPTQEKAIASASPSQWKDVPPAELRWRKATRSMGSNQ